MRLLLALLALPGLVVLVAGCGQAPDDVPADTGVQGTVLIGPTCPVERDPPEPGCEDRPYRAHFEVLTLDDRRVTDFWSLEDGSFRVPLEPGQYRIGPVDDQAAPPTCSRTEPFTIRVGEYTEVDVACDSGIR